MQIPNQFSMTKVDGSEPPTSIDDKSGWFQHHRNEDLKVGCVSRCHRRGSPTLQTWYCDHIMGSTFSTLQELQRAALIVTDKDIENTSKKYPVLSSIEPLEAPAKGHSSPRCSLFLNEPATHVAVLVRSWNNDWNTTVFLGKKAFDRTKKEKSAAWVADMLRDRAVQS